MITEIEFVAQNDTLIEYKKNGVKSAIFFSDIEPYWSYATEDDFEGGTAKLVDDKILFTLLTASSQGGIVAVWDTETGRLEHISEGSYCVAVDAFDDKIFRLLCESNFVTKANLQLWETPYGIMDADDEGTQVRLAIPDIVDEFDGDCSKIALTVSDKAISITLNGKVYCIER